MKKILLSCFILLLCNLLQAQTFKMDPNSEPLEPSKISVLDTAKIRIQYRQFIIQDTTDMNKKTEHIMLLQIGNNISKYADYYGLKGDSILLAKEEEGKGFDVIFAEIQPYIKGTSRDKLFKNYPKGKVTCIAFFAAASYLYEELPANIKWKFEQGNLIVAGYNCKKATTTLFGRKYTAWYTPDIPISNGPWKLSGLPGLILKAEDSRKQISFECIAIEKPRWINPIYINDQNYARTNKKTFLRLYREYREDPLATLQNSGMLPSNINVPPKSRKRPYNPIELSE